MEPLTEMEYTKGKVSIENELLGLICLLTVHMVMPMSHRQLDRLEFRNKAPTEC
jgi:hypothetical protein